MSLNPRETVMTALFNLLTSSIATSFTATGAANSSVLTGLVGAPRLFVGMPISGPSGVLPAGTFVQDLSTPGQVTLSQNALAAAIGGAFTTGFRTTGRRAIYAKEVTSQPALYLVEIADEYPATKTRMPARVTIEAEVWLYSNAGKDPDLPPVAPLNNLIDAVAAVLKPLPVIEAQNLGLPDLVQHCWIEGRAKKHPGYRNGQAIAVIPVRILTKAML